jgi:hypothetical protein
LLATANDGDVEGGDATVNRPFTELAPRAAADRFHPLASGEAADRGTVAARRNALLSDGRLHSITVLATEGYGINDAVDDLAARVSEANGGLVGIVITEHLSEREAVAISRP